MPWFVWMSFLTVPVLVGVGCTLASDRPNDPEGFITVLVTSCLWVFIAYCLKNFLRESEQKKWPHWWFTLAVILPLLVLFLISLRHNPQVMKRVHARWSSAQKADAKLAVAAPARRVFTWAESKEILAHMQPSATDFVVKLFTSMPLVWWFLAFGISIGKGTRAWKS